MIQTRKREHSRKPDEQYELIASCSPGPYLELFGRGVRKGWTTWGDQADDSYQPTWKTYAYNSRAERNSNELVGRSLTFCDEPFNGSPWFAEGDKAGRQPNQQARARVSDAAMSSILEFAPNAW